MDADATSQTSAQETSDYKYALDKTSIITITNPKGIITYVNDNFCNISKYSREELIGQDHRIVNSGEHPKQFMRNLWATITGGKIWRGEIKNKAKDGTYYWVDTSIIPFMNEHREIYQYLIIRTDVTPRHKAEEEIIHLNEALEKKVIDRTAELVKSESRIRSFSTHLNRVLEEERARIARELHDELGQQLAGIKMGLASLGSGQLSFLNEQKAEGNNGQRTTNHEQLSAKIKDMVKDVDYTIQSLRKIATALRPGILDSLGLVPSIVWLGSEFEKKTHIQCTHALRVAEQKFEKNLSTCFFRICQEALTNISKHAAASEVFIHITQTKTELSMKICDNGKGICSEKLENPFSMGLLGMRERANIIGADLNISGQKNLGTTVQIKANVLN